MATSSIPHSSGVYKILCITTGKFYIGSSVNMLLRWRVHRAELRGNRHCNQHLQRAWNKCGEEAFVITVIECCDRDNLTSREQFYLDLLQPFDEQGFNIGRDARVAARGRKQSPEERAKRSATEKGRVFTPEHRAKIGAAHKGKVLSPQHRSKLSQAHTGKSLSPEHRAKVAAAGKGRKQKPESIAKVVAATAKSWLVISPDGIEMVITNMKKFCRENNLHPSHMSAVALGKLKHHKGWKCSHVT